MSFLFSHWKEEKSNEELYNEIFGHEKIGLSEIELSKEIEKKLSDNFVSNIERKKLLKLQNKMYNES